MKNKLALCLTLFLISVKPALVWSQTIDEVYTKYIAALGGRENLDAIQTMQMEWVNAKGQRQIAYLSRPSLALYLLTDTASNIMVKVCNNSGISCLSDKKIVGTDTSFRLQFIRPSGKPNFFANKLIPYKENGYKISLQGEDIIEGKRCFVVQLEPDKKSYDLYYIDADTYRLVMSQTRYLSGPDGAQIYYSDYRQVNGVWFPFTVEDSGSSPTAAKKTYTYMKANIPIDKNIFVCPTM
ncbi:outer membrane lipoprotein-sorting protein [Xanthocytophaga flava]|uniref:outer membrane lipoprotein-sorting protein n=1 Tax=Xanthocytophaga flava TaxID=3048013 RepID=UPI0028D32F8E|nr:DUF4292 domain-containing protein [Xanthocytophaga flavus]MDJ1469997.1 DUF4292 domain-containing protein [Xanthocytophaga flavus]